MTFPFENMPGHTGSVVTEDGEAGTCSSFQMTLSQERRAREDTPP